MEMVNKFLNKITLVFGFIFISKNLIYPRFFFFKMSEVHLFFFLTKITFKVTVLIIILLFFFFKNKTIKSVLIVLSVYILTNSEFFYKKNIILEPVNIGLFNSLNQYHPPLFIFTTMFYIFCKLNFLKTRNVLNALLITTLLSMWWASQELFWGSYWNWDNVEMTLLLTIIIIFIDTHLDSKVKTVSENYYTRFIIFLFFLIFYLINRSPLSISVHSFTNSFYCKIDNILFYIMIFILISIALYFGYLKKPFIRINYRVSFLYTNVLLLYIITIAITFKLSNITGLGFKEFYKNVILGLFICLYIISLKKLYKFFYINKKVYKSNVNHIVPAIYLFIVYFFNESSSNFLFTQKIFGNLNCFRVSNFSLTEVNDFVCPDNTLLSNFFNKKYKNLTFLKVNNGYCISAMYRKYNSNIFFEYIDSNNKVKLYFIALVLKFRN